MPSQLYLLSMKFLGKNLISEIERVHISIDEIEKNSHFKELFLKAALYGISQIRGLGVDYKRSMLYKKDIYANKNNVTIHEAIECGLSFVPQKKYVLVFNHSNSLFYF